MSINELIEKVKQRDRPEKELAEIRRAYDFAEHAHRGQTRESGEAYIVHPLWVAMRLTDLNLDTPTIIATLLHDVCEDTECTADTIEKNFGVEAARLVEGVTKLDKIRYQGTERNAESLRKMFLAIAEDIRIVLIKLMDRLHNMQTLNALSPEKQRRIALETLEIYAPLAYRLGIGELKGQLEDLAFPYVYPTEYQWLRETLKDHFEDRKQYVERLKPIVAEELTREHIPFVNLHARAKHYYSLYKKLLKFDMDLDKVFDLVALRLIVHNEEECYGALGVVHKLWRPVPGLVKDYIALPKPNGYRSLHTTVFGPEGRVIEFQIRTQEMHEMAENGIAAHWAYTEQKGTKGYVRLEPSFASTRELLWIRQLREWQKDFEKPDEFLDALKIDFFKNRIFVLTPKGDVFDLPEGATAIDFAYAVHTDIGNTAVGAKVNNRIQPLNHELLNGAVVEILTQKNRKPSRDWLEFIKTAGARKKISSFFKKRRETEAFQKRGGELIELRLNVHDRIGLLRDVSNIFARGKINMKTVTSDSKNRAFPLMTIHAAFKSRRDLEKLVLKLKGVKEIEEISYKLL